MNELGPGRTPAGGGRPGRQPIRVMIVDDSASVRMALADIVSSAADLEVFATAGDPFAAVARMRDGLPDVMILDIEMPKMDGLSFLRRIMAQRPLPVIICSSLFVGDAASIARAVEAGAVDVIAKPRVHSADALRESQLFIRDAIRRAGRGDHAARRPAAAAAMTIERRNEADVILRGLTPAEVARRRTTLPRTPPIVCIGVSTGGTEALPRVFAALPADCPPIVVVQHMPSEFTGSFARRLDAGSRIRVAEAQDGDALLPGQALIAPGDRHMLLQRRGQRHVIELRDGPSVARHRPSADVLFRSAAQEAGANAVGVIMTGMGDDGARGLREMRDMGARTLGQSERSCIVYGMPKMAAELGGVERSVDLDQIAREILRAIAAIHAGER